MGRLAFPSLIVQALAPSAGALVIEYRGSRGDRGDADRHSPSQTWCWSEFSGRPAVLPRNAAAS